MSCGRAICDVAILLPASDAADERRVDLEVDVRPAARVAGGEDAGERHHPVVARRLHAAQVVLVLGALGVQRVAALPVAVPDVDRRARERLAAVALVLDQRAGSSAAPPRPCPRTRRRLVVMSLRTTPLSVSTSGPLVPSPGNGPAVSSGITGAQASALVDDGGGRRRPTSGRRRDGAWSTGGEERADPGQAHQLQHAAAIDERRPRRPGGPGRTGRTARAGRPRRWGGLGSSWLGSRGCVDDREACRTT